MSTLDPFACGPQCCDDPCDKKDPLEILITNGAPQGKPDPCDHLPIAYDAATGCFYLWHENSGWFEASGVEVSMEDTDAAGRGDTWRVKVCSDEIEIVNSRNYEFGLEALDTDPAGRPRHLVLKQTHGPTLTVDLNDLDSWVSAFTIQPLPGGGYALRIEQTAGRPTLTLPLPKWLLTVATDDTIDGNGTTDSPLTVNWDAICAAAETVTDADGHRVILCGPDGVKGIDPSDLLTDICFDNVPDLGSQCGVVDQLVLVTNNGCGSLAKTRAATQAQSVLYFQQVASPRLPDNTGGYSIPADLPNPSNYYTRADYVSDGGVNMTSGVTGSVRPAPGLNEAKISNSRWGSVSWENACQNTYELEVNIAHAKMDTAEAAYDAWSGVGFRFRVNGGAWNYPFSPGPGTLNIFAGDNGLLGTRQVSTQLGIPAGAIDFEVFYIGNTTPETTVRWQANTFVPGFAVSSPRAFLRRAA